MEVARLAAAESVAKVRLVSDEPGALSSNVAQMALAAEAPVDALVQRPPVAKAAWDSDVLSEPYAHTCVR